MAGRLQGKVAIVTGSSSNLGRAIALAYAAQGASLCCLDLYPSPRPPITLSPPLPPSSSSSSSPSPQVPKPRAQDHHTRSSSLPSTHQILREKYGADRAIFAKTDVTKAGDIKASIEKCVAWKGRVDVVVANAGISVESNHATVTRADETSEEDWDRTMAVNAKGVFLTCKYSLRQMLEQDLLEEEKGKGEGKGHRGWIVNIASVQALVGYYGTPSYCAAKGAVLQLTKQIAVDYAKDRIHCNAICPGFLKTNMTQNLLHDPILKQKTDDAHPFGGMGDVEDIARAAVFLASEDTAWVTGVGLVVDGGFTAL